MSLCCSRRVNRKGKKISKAKSEGADIGASINGKEHQHSHQIKTKSDCDHGLAEDQHPPLQKAPSPPEDGHRRFPSAEVRRNRGEEGQGAGGGAVGETRGPRTVLSTFRPRTDDGFSDYDNPGGIVIAANRKWTERGAHETSKDSDQFQERTASERPSVSGSAALSPSYTADDSLDEAVKSADMELDLVIEMMKSMAETTCAPSSSRRPQESMARPPIVNHSEHPANQESVSVVLEDTRSPESTGHSNHLSSTSAGQQSTNEGASTLDQISRIPSTIRPYLQSNKRSDDNDAPSSSSSSSSSSSLHRVAAKATSTTTMMMTEPSNGLTEGFGGKGSLTSRVPSDQESKNQLGYEDGYSQDRGNPKECIAQNSLDRVSASERTSPEGNAHGFSNFVVTSSRSSENSIQLAESSSSAKTIRANFASTPFANQPTGQTVVSGSILRSTVAGGKETVESDSSSIDSNLENSFQFRSTVTGDQFTVHRLSVLKATSKLLDFVKEIWKKQGSLHHNLHKIRLLCLHLKNDLQELENFGLCLVCNLPEEERRSCEKKLFPHTKLLQNIRNGINRYLQSLEEEAVGDRPKEFSTAGEDDQLKTKVGNIILLTRVIPGLVRAFGSFVDDLAKIPTKNELPLISSDDRLNARPTSDEDGSVQKDSPPVPKVESVKRIRENSSTCKPPAIPPKRNHSENRGNIESNYSFVPKLVNAPPSDISLGPREEPRREEAHFESTSHNSLPASGISPTSSAKLKNDDDDDDDDDEVVLRRKPNIPWQAKSSIDASSDDSESIGDSGLSTPDIRGSDLSLTVQVQLEELRRQAKDQSVQLHTDNSCDFHDYDIPAGILEENLFDLCESDRKLLLFYSDEMFDHWKVLDNAASAFFHCVESSQPPKAFVMHSRFVIVAGHKMTYIGDVLARNMTDGDVRNRLLDRCNDLCERLKSGVRTTKEAALRFPAVVALQLMVDDIKDVTNAAYELRELLFRLAYLGKADQSFAWQVTH